MIYRYIDLIEKYKNYKNSKAKIQREIADGKYYKIIRGLYTDDLSINGYLVANFIVQPSYLSFEYALSKYGLIPEKVVTYTSATTLTKHNKLYKTIVGDFSFTDVPIEVWPLGIKLYTENDYTYLLATPEKALCDLLYKTTPVSNVNQLKDLIFNDFRIDEQMFYKLNKNDIILLCGYYKRKNLKLLNKMLVDGENYE